ncbi:MAG: FG-GAP-like repeat-containing protein, partial [bacterium]
SGYHYYVRGRDAMGNVSAASETLEAWTGAPYVAGWPAELRGAVFSSPVAGDATHRGWKEIFAGSKGWDMAGFDRSGQSLPGFPYVGVCEVWSSPALADLDGDGRLECVFGEGKAPYGVQCGRVVALNSDGTFVSADNNRLLSAESAGWPQVVSGPVRSSPTICDLDKDGLVEIIVGIENRNELWVFRGDGDPYLAGSYIFGHTSSGIWATPAVSDLDGDGSSEVIVCDLAGCLYIWRSDGSAYLEDERGLVDSTGGIFWGSPVVGDTDGDGLPEIVAAGLGGGIYAWNHDGSHVRPGGAVLIYTEGATWGSPALADFDGDGALDIAVAVGQDEGRLILLKGDGSAFGDSAAILEWPRAMGYASCAVADVDNDAALEIVACTEDGYVLAVKPSGASSHGFPKRINGYIYSSPLVDDLDRDGTIEIAVGGYDSRIHLWDLGSPWTPERVPWGMFHHDAWHTGSYGFTPPADVAPPSYAVAVYRNPVLERALDVFVKIDEPVEDVPSLWVASGEAETLDVDVVSGDKYIFRGHHLAGGAAAETVFVAGTDMYGNSGTASRIMTFSQTMGDRLVASSWDGVVRLEAARPSESALLAILPVDRDYLDSGTAPAGSGCIYNISVVSGSVAGIHLRAHAGIASDAALWRLDEDWVLVENQYRSGTDICADAVASGIYCLGRAARQASCLTLSPKSANPFTDRCAFVVAAGHGEAVSVEIFDVRGRLVKEIFRGGAAQPADVRWEGTDASGARAASGIYFAVARAGGERAIQKMVLVR